jgi:acyl carrier protein
MNKQEILTKIKPVILKLTSDPLQFDIVESHKFESDLGFDSLDGIEFIMECERLFNINVNDEEAFTCETVNDAIELIERRLK